VKSTALKHAGLLWDYLASKRSRAPSDAVVVCCSYDLRVCDYACELIRQGFAPRLVLAGNTGNWTRHLWDVPEAHIFKDRALANGVDSSRIVLETESTNFGENIAFVRRLMPNLERVIQYPARGFQVPHALPQDILESWRALIAEGFGQHLLPAE